MLVGTKAISRTTEIFKKAEILMPKCFLLLLFLFFLPGGANAQGTIPDGRAALPRVPHLIFEGLDKYKEKGPESAIETWIKAGPIEGAPGVLAKGPQLRQIQTVLGAYQGFDILSVTDVTPRTRIVYLAINFEKGPVYLRFVTYKIEYGWLVTKFDFDTQEEFILPRQ